MTTTRIYGRFLVGMPHSPDQGVDRIEGVRLSTDRAGQPDWIELQYRRAGEDRVQQMQMPWLEAMALLSMLKCLQLDAGFPFPDDPRG